MTDVDTELRRFKDIITKDWERTEWEGGRLHPVSRLSSIVIACRHFARSGDLPAMELLRIASEVTGLPMETMTDADGASVSVWRPARGEVGWLPYDVPPAHWTGADWKWDDFAGKWIQPGAHSGPAINHVAIGA